MYNQQVRKDQVYAQMQKERKKRMLGRKICVDSYGTLNTVLVSLFRDVLDIEQRTLAISEFQDLTNNDMHVIEAIGLGTPKNMSAIARQLRVTTGTLTISMNSLVKKGYVKRERSEQDRRVVYIMLTAKGKK